MRTLEVMATSDLAADMKTVWARIASFEGVNHELGPWLRMTAPAGVELSPAAVPIGRRWFRSWVLALGVVPVDYDDLRVERIEPPRGFLERSIMLSARVWEHERTLEPIAGGTRLTDRVSFVPRVGATARLHRMVVAAIFRHRHRRLQGFFGG